MKSKYFPNSPKVYHRITFFSFAVFFPFFIAACSSGFNNENQFSAEHLINSNSIKANLRFLASDELEGREATTKAERISALFIASELQKYGVKPYFNDFLQEFDVHSISVDPESKLAIVKSTGDKIQLTCFDDFFPHRKYTVTTEGNYKLVFAGYGITSPEFNYNDYANIDVNGKIVVIADGEPSGLDTVYFEGKKKSKYSEDSVKISLARNMGASGIITIPSNFYLMNWENIKKYAKGEALSLAGKEEEKLLNLIFNEESLSVLFDNEKYSFKDIKNLIYYSNPLPVFEMNKEIEVDIIMNEALKTAYNVAGLIEGNDSLYRDEYVAIGAHYDHLGVIDDKVYNGADDNGSGTVGLLEVAKAFAKTGSNKRSILVVFHGAEEKGLLGSEYFTSNFENINNIIAHINMDMIGREHIDTIYSVGSGKLSSEFKRLVEEVNSQTVNFIFNYKFDNPNDRHRIYYRSDHYNYARNGIPVVFFYDYMNEDYHKHTDEIDKINFNKIRKTALLVYNIALRTANLDERLMLDSKEVSRSIN